MVVVSDGSAVYADAVIGGDEPVQLAAKFPKAVVIVDEQKGRAAEYAARKYNVDVVILDDGFQHRAVRRNLDIVMIGGKTSLERIPLLPAGIRREPLSALGRAHLIVVSGGMNVLEETQELEHCVAPRAKMEFKPTACVEVERRNTISLEILEHQSCIAFCGIANPQSFYSTLTALRMDVVDVVTFRDHHNFGNSDLKLIEDRFLRHHPRFVMTTEKDAVRLHSRDLSGIKFAGALHYLEIEAKVIEGESILHSLLESTIRGHA